MNIDDVGVFRDGFTVCPVEFRIVLAEFTTSHKLREGVRLAQAEAVASQAAIGRRRRRAPGLVTANASLCSPSCPLYSDPNWPDVHWGWSGSNGELVSGTGGAYALWKTLIEQREAKQMEVNGQLISLGFILEFYGDFWSTNKHGIYSRILWWFFDSTF